MAAGELPEKIYPKTRIIRTQTWYEQQSRLWAQWVAKNPGDSEAWLEYYAASRYAQTSPVTLATILQEMEARVSGDAAYALARAWQGLYTPSGHAALQTLTTTHAYRGLTDMLRLLDHEFYGEASERAQVSRRLFEQQLVSPSLLNYSYNVLMSLGEGALLVTEGENTAVPVYMLQDVLGLRRDVHVLCLDMLVQPPYRTRTASLMGIRYDERALATAPDIRRALCSQLANQGQQPVYYALTVARENVSDIKEQLYVVGLASQASATRVDNVARIRENLEQRFLLDYLSVDFNGEDEHAAGRMLQSNYLVSMLMLHDRYRQAGNTDAADKWERTIEQLAHASGKTDLVEQYWKRYAVRIPDAPYKLDVKTVEGKFRHVYQQIYAAESEVTNEAFNAFLLFLVDNKFTREYERYKFDMTGLSEPALSFMKNYTSARVPQKKEKYFTNYPAVQVTYEAAEAYCQWLTDQYNKTEGRKYKQVKFRLPSIAEWQLAAHGVAKASSWALAENVVEVKIYADNKVYSKDYETKKVTLDDPEVLYPWFRNYNFRKTVINQKGCALGNFRFPEGQVPCRPVMNTVDGFMMMSPVGAYFPNDIGLYDVVGNVAEMTQEKGKACGGSWNLPPESSTIKSINLYEGPQSDVGFRVFMEVIQP